MFPAIKLHAPNPPKPYLTFSLNRPSSSLPFSSLSFSTADRESPSSLTSSVGSPPSPHLAQWNLSRRHIHLLGFVACTVTFLSPALFVSLIRFLWRICMQILLFHWFLPSLGNGILIFFLVTGSDFYVLAVFLCNSCASGVCSFWITLSFCRILDNRMEKWLFFIKK